MSEEHLTNLSILLYADMPAPCTDGRRLHGWTVVLLMYELSKRSDGDTSFAVNGLVKTKPSSLCHVHCIWVKQEQKVLQKSYKGCTHSLSC